jgi:hypothetical protein
MSTNMRRHTLVASGTVFAAVLLAGTSFAAPKPVKVTKTAH